MEKLLRYLNSLPKPERAVFVAACEVSEAYLRKACSVGQRLGTTLCISLERESKGEVRCEDLIPDADWAYIRATGAEPSTAMTAPATPQPLLHERCIHDIK